VTTDRTDRTDRVGTSPGDAPADDLGGWTFEQLVGELERIARQMEAPDLGIEEATELYATAGRIHAAAAERLARVQARVSAMGDSGG